tara:strand:- start:7230 stop:7487 length:258 start_codon:yes stop_codon:yes gene_type:complete
MRSKEVAQLLKKWTQSQEFKGWSDYMVDRTIEALDSSDFSFDDLNPQVKTFVPYVEEDDLPKDDNQDSSPKIVVPRTSSNDWLTF